MIEWRSNALRHGATYKADMDEVAKTDPGATVVSDPWRPGKIGQRRVGRIDVLHQFTVFFRPGFHALPLRVVLKSLPVRGRRLAARMLQNIKESAAFRGLIQRRPVGNTLHPV